MRWSRERKFGDISFVDNLVSFEEGDFLLISRNVSSEFEILAVLSFNDKLNVVDKSLGRFNSLDPYRFW